MSTTGPKVPAVLTPDRTRPFREPLTGLRAGSIGLADLRTGHHRDHAYSKQRLPLGLHEKAARLQGDRPRHAGQVALSRLQGAALPTPYAGNGRASVSSAIWRPDPAQGERGASRPLAAKRLLSPGLARSCACWGCEVPGSASDYRQHWHRS